MIVPPTGFMCLWVIFSSTDDTICFFIFVKYVKEGNKPIPVKKLDLNALPRLPKFYGQVCEIALLTYYPQFYFQNHPTLLCPYNQRIQVRILFTVFGFNTLNYVNNTSPRVLHSTPNWPLVPGVRSLRL